MSPSRTRNRIEAAVASNVTVVPQDSPAPVSDRLLSDLHMGEDALVVSISRACRTALRRRLMDLGIVPGTVVRAEGAFSYQGKRYKLVDLPGTYSLLSASHDEEIVRNFLLFGQPDVTLIVVDSTRLERNLNLVLQVLESISRVDAPTHPSTEQ